MLFRSVDCPTGDGPTGTIQFRFMGSNDYYFQIQALNARYKYYFLFYRGVTSCMYQASIREKIGARPQRKNLLNSGIAENKRAKLPLKNNQILNYKRKHFACACVSQLDSPLNLHPTSNPFIPPIRVHTIAHYDIHLSYNPYSCKTINKRTSKFLLSQDSRGWD